MTDFRALCAELLLALEGEGYTHWTHSPDEDDLVLRARAALAEPEPEGPTLDDIWELCEEHGFVLGIDGAHEDESAEGLLSIARAVLARWGNPAPHSPADVSQLSDGYHTFAELYEHRHSLMLALMRAQPHICWFSRRHADGELPFGSDDWFIVGAELPDAPITYHLPAALYSLAQKTGAIELLAGRPWDGHTAADVVQRLRDWAITPPPPADGEVAELVAKLRKLCSDLDYDDCGEEAGYCYRAADLLQRQYPQPVPVNERLPSPEDCDAEGRCWVWWKNGVRWVLDEWTHHELKEGPLSGYISHWLPAHALPLPTAND